MQTQFFQTFLLTAAHVRPLLVLSLSKKKIYSRYKINITLCRNVPTHTKIDINQPYLPLSKLKIILKICLMGQNPSICSKITYIVVFIILLPKYLQKKIYSSYIIFEVNLFFFSF